ncbi:hypothetical protein GPECTOR_12g604 [Gonium pectorale]|uniref:Uncharacterized protein n=1 Tax=Gonium pectorale TaxID=33097 RepID=A0A150GQL8_GONPE|nr:hypothetical protein GPECTOR_12g604 [Gonium pectorale]|eukprot:KXZ51640.1 hypothetical protein GPECTOR_12g604 [Gonium pectorale]
MPPKKRRAVAVEPAAEPKAGGAVDLDEERRERMARNAAMLAQLGVGKAVTSVRDAVAAERTNACAGTSQAKARRARSPKPQLAPRRSQRIAGVQAPAMVELDDHGNPIRAARGGVDESGQEPGLLLDLLANGAPRLAKGVNEGDLSEEQKEKLERLRCSAKGRRRVYSSAGTCCHFCRQKTLCGEEGCPRCSERNDKLVCIGTTWCNRCKEHTGVFCRACLLVRSFCMRDHDKKPTGIAIHQARRAGYASVAHMLQAAVLAMKDRKAAGPVGRGNKAARNVADREGGAERLQAEQQQAAEAGPAAAAAALEVA